MSACGLFFDRDGTLVEHVHYLHEPSRVRILPGVADTLRTLRETGHRLFLFTNQSGVGRGMFSLEDALACNARMLELMGLSEDFWDDVCTAPEAPDQPQRYRKPSPRFVLESMEKFSLKPEACQVLGDRWSDAQAGLNAGVRAALLETGLPLDEKTRRRAAEHDVPVYPDLPAFAAAEPYRS